MNENMKTMNEKQQAANGREAYEAPKCEIIEMQNEGSFCDIMVLSGNAGHDGIGEQDWGGRWD